MTEDQVYAVLVLHRPAWCGEDTPNVWKTLCTCGWLGADLERHQAEEILRPEPMWISFADGTKGEQLTIPGVLS